MNNLEKMNLSLTLVIQLKYTTRLKKETKKELKYLKELLSKSNVAVQTKLSQLEELLMVQELKKLSQFIHQELKKLKLLDMVKLDVLNYTI